MSREIKNQQFIDDFMAKVEFDPNTHRFTAELPIKEGLQPGLNLNLAKARLKSLERSLAKTGTRDRYEAELRTLMELGFVERVDSNHKPDGPVSYIPHKAVTKEESLTTKLRIVFDASAKEKGSLSLNETLHSGPNLTQEILAVIMRFRTQPVALLADIEKSFPQMVVRERCRDAMRFLWRLDGGEEPQVFRLTRNYFGFASSSFILASCIRTLLEWFEPNYPETVATVRRNYYVDDLAIGAPSEQQAIELYTQAKEIFSHGSFNLRKCIIQKH